MIYGLIICAGNQSRFKVELPKALVDVNGTCLLDLNIENMSKYCDKVFVVVSNKNKNYFTKYNIISINSGFGCGDAVMKAIQFLNLNKDDTCFIQWGDCLHDKFIYSSCISNYNNKHVLIPCTFENNPYVQIKQVDIDHVNAYFSKFKDNITPGFHDLSLFYGNSKSILNSCIEFKDKYWEGNYYKHKHNDEFSFLDIFNETNIYAKIYEIKNYNVFAFNTLEELNNLLKNYHK